VLTAYASSGKLLIAEVSSRFESVQSFVAALYDLGFNLVSKVRSPSPRPSHVVRTYGLNRVGRTIRMMCLFCLSYKSRNENRRHRATLC
jgi:hypothetical protein